MAIMKTKDSKNAAINPASGNLEVMETGDVIPPFKGDWTEAKKTITSYGMSADDMPFMGIIPVYEKPERYISEISYSERYRTRQGGWWRRNVTAWFVPNSQVVSNHTLDPL